MPWITEYWSDVETNSNSASGRRRFPAAEASLSDVLARVCGPALIRRPWLPDIGAVPVGSDNYLSAGRSRGLRFSRVGAAWLRPDASRYRGLSFGSVWQVLFGIESGDV